MTSTSTSSLSSSSWSTPSSRSSFSSKSSSSNSSKSLSSISSPSTSQTISSSSKSSSSYTENLSSMSSFSDYSISSVSSSKSLSSQSYSSLSSPPSRSSLSSSESTKSVSSLTSTSSRSSASTQAKTSSSSVSTEFMSSFSSESYSSSFSSSSSGPHAFATMAFRVEVVKESPVWCFEPYKRQEGSSSDSLSDRVIYAGTGPSGEVLYSTDLVSWSVFTTVDDCHVRSLKVWANALFMGTQPNGRIYVHNFTTGNKYLFVQTEDESVTCFAEYDGKIFAGTAPAGIVYSFDGYIWKEEYRPYGNGVTAMVVYGDLLVVFSRKAEGAVTFNGVKWEMHDDTKTIASMRSVKGGIYGVEGQQPINPETIANNGRNGVSDQNLQEVMPTSPQFNIETAVESPSGPIIGGSNNGAVLRVGQSLTKLLDIGRPVKKILNINGTTIIVSSKDTLFLAKE